MTDTLPDVVVTGQRRTPGVGSFPTLPATIIVPAPFETPEVQKGDPIEVEPCAFPAFRRRWDADAAAAAAVAAFLARAASLGGQDAPNGNADLAFREFGVAIRGVPRGGTTLGNISHGPPQLLPNGAMNPDGSTVVIDETGITGFNFRGWVHSHPSGSLIPSPMGPDGNGDWAVFNRFRNMVIGAGLDASGLTMYMVGYNSETGGYTILAYDWNDDHVNEPREVNPNATPCPAS